MVAKKDYNAPKHIELDVPNLHVIKACQSLNSRGFIKTQFSWNVSHAHGSLIKLAQELTYVWLWMIRVNSTTTTPSPMKVSSTCENGRY